MPTTLKDYATQQQSTYRSLLDAARTELEAAQLELRPALTGSAPTLQDKLSETKSSIKEKEQLIATKRRELAATTVPSEATALIAEITALTIELNGAYAELLDNREAVNDATARAAFAQSRVARFAAALVRADKELATATEEDGARQALSAVIATSLATIPAQATTLLASAELTAARAKIGATRVPAKLIELARLRHETTRHRLALAEGRLARVRTHVADRAETDDGVAGEATKTQIAFAAALQELTTYAATARERLVQSTDTVDRIRLGDDLLSDAEHDDAFDAGMLTDREAAGDQELAVLAAELELDDANDALAAERIAARALDPDASDAVIDAVAAVAAAIAERDGKQDALDLAGDDFASDERAALRTWQTIVPPLAWKSIVDLLDAEATLTVLGAIVVDPTNAASLQRKLTAAEGAYGDALVARAESGRAHETLGDMAALERARLEAARADERTRVLSAVRGDAT